MSADFSTPFGAGAEIPYNMPSGPEFGTNIFIDQPRLDRIRSDLKHKVDEIRTNRNDSSQTELGGEA